MEVFCLFCLSWSRAGYLVRGQEKGLYFSYGNEDLGNLSVEDHDFEGRTGMISTPWPFSVRLDNWFSDIPMPRD